MAKQILVPLDVSGDISDDSGNTIYDYSNSYIPDSIIQQSSLDADTLDSVQLTNISWSDVSMATSDVGSSDVGLGNVTNDAQVAKDGSITWTGGQDAGGNSVTNQSTSWSDFNNLDLSNVNNAAQANFLTAGQATVNLADGDSLQLLRTHIPTGKSIKVIKAAVSQKDGTYGTAGLDIEVYNQTDAATIYSFNASGTTVEGLDDGSYSSPLATGGTGDEIIIRISNSTGSAQDVQGWLKAVVE